MKIRTLLVLLSLASMANAQITITQNDLPSVNETFYLSNGNPVNNYDFTLSGENYNWDFSELESINQQIQSFIPVSGAPFAYQLFFNNPFDQEHYASFATAQDGFELSAQFTFQDFYAFYQKNESAYSIVGNAGTINGIPLPAPSNPVDVIYDLPLEYGSMGSNYSEWQVQIPGLLTYKLKQTRNYEVDGWGTITTPLGTFEALRVRMEIDAIDSISLEALSFNFENPRSSVEYQWLGAEMGSPVLVATENLGFTSSIVYQDEEIISVNEVARQSIMIYPNPSNGDVQLNSSLNGSLLLFDMDGRLIKSWANINSNQRIDLSDLDNGVYLIQNPESGLSSRVVVNH